MADNALLRLANMYRDARAEADKDPGSMASQVNRLVMAGSPEEHAYYEVMGQSGDGMDHSGLQELVEGRPSGQPKNVTLDNLVDVMYEEFTSTYGYKPTDDTAKVIAASFRGRDLTKEDVRADFYERVAAYDGKQPQEQPDGRTSMAGGNRSGGHVDPAAGYEDNDGWLRAVSTMQHQAGLK